MKLLSDSSVKVAIFRNGTIQLIWWIVFFPGFYSADSFAVLQMAKSGELNGMWSAPWALLVQILSLGGIYPGLVTLFLSLVFSISLTLFIYSLFSPKRSALISGVIHLTPLVGAMGITLWHDIPMTSGFFLVSTFCVQVRKSGVIEREALIKLLIPGMILSTFRGNGIPTLLIFLAIFVIIEKEIKNKRLIIIAITFSFLTIWVSNTQMTQKVSSDLDIATSWIISDLSCYAGSSNGKGFVEKYIPNIGTTDSWSSPSACTWFSDADLTPAEIDKARNQIPGLLINLVKEDPSFLVTTHLKRHRYLFPLPIYGIPRPPFIHSTIEFSDGGVEWKFKAIAEVGRNYVRVWNYFSFLLAYAGIWFSLILVLAITKRSRDVLSVALLSLILITSLFVFAGISDARYVLFVLIAGQALGLNLIIEISKYSLRKLKREN